MATIAGVGVKNLRSLKSIAPNVRIKPITILLGKNSVGKSTFARIFPLFRQSSERRKRSPVLWFGDLVDFGSLGRAVSEGETEMAFSFDLKFNGIERGPRTNWATGPGQVSWGVPASAAQLKSASITLTLAENDEQMGSATSVTIKTLGSSIKLVTDEREHRLLINDQEYVVPKENLMYSFQGDVLPLIYFYSAQQDEGKRKWVPTYNPFLDQPALMIRQAVHGNTSMATARKLARQIPLGTPAEIEAAILKISGPQSWKNCINSSVSRKSLARRLHSTLLLAAAEQIFGLVDQALSTYFAGVRYLKPLRATAERFYRRVDLSVSEIDTEGRNLPMFLDSLPHARLEEFRQWIRDHLEIDVFPKREGDQIMIMAKGKYDPKPFNIADMGFGISQVLPVAAQLWAAGVSLGQAKQASVIVLEQPELHLHPEYQARLADLFVAAAANGSGSTPAPPLIIETHSQQIVNRLGELVEQKKIRPEDVTILLFENSRESEASTIRVAEFDENGVLSNWPYGFFEPEMR